MVRGLVGGLVVDPVEQVADGAVARRQQVGGQVLGGVGVAGLDGCGEGGVGVDAVDLGGHGTSEHVEHGFVGGTQAVEHQPVDDGPGPFDHDVPEREGSPLAGDPVRGNVDGLHRLREGWSLPRLGGRTGQDRADGGTGADDVADHPQVQSPVPDDQAREEVQSGVPTEVTNAGAPTLPDLDQPGLREPLERRADGGPADGKGVGEVALARERAASGEAAGDDPVDQLVGDLVGHRPPLDGLQVVHAPDARPTAAFW